MTDMKKKIDHAKNKIGGELKEVAGKITGNEQLELKGKIQSSKADLKQNLNVENNVSEIKEKIAGKINDHIDKREKKSKKR